MHISHLIIIALCIIITIITYGSYSKLALRENEDCEIKNIPVKYHVKSKHKIGKSIYYLFESIKNKQNAFKFYAAQYLFKSIEISDTIRFNKISQNNFIQTKQLGKFSYKYWKKKNTIHKLIKAPPFSTIKNKSANNPISTKVVRSLLWEWSKKNFSFNTAGLVYALLCGDKSYLNRDIKRSLQTSGIYHIIAVSGLHIGMVFLIIQTLNTYLLKFNKWSLINISISLLAVWYFAYIAALTPSALRASFMITLIAIGKAHLKEAFCYKNILHLFWVVLIINLCINPKSLFDIGFQFSYLAYGGILLFYRTFNNKRPHKLNFLKKPWSIASLSLSAQCMVLPLSILYFKQIPTYFLIGNLIITPLLPLFYILIIISFAVNNFSSIPIHTTELLLNGFIWFSKKLNNIAGALIKWEDFNVSCCILFYLIITLWALHLYKLKKYYSISIILFISIIPIFSHIENLNNDSLLKIKYTQKNKVPVILNFKAKNKAEMHIYRCSELNINNLLLDEELKEIYKIIPHCHRSMQEVPFKNGVILILNGWHLKNTVDINNPKDITHIICLNSPYIKFELLNYFPSLKMFYYDNTNKDTYIRYWKKRCKEDNITYFKLPHQFYLDS